MAVSTIDARRKAKTYMSHYVSTETYKASQKAYRKSEKGRATYKAWRVNYYNKPENRLRLLAKSARHRAKLSGLDFDEAVVELLAANMPDHCACCGGALDYSTGRGPDRWDSPSIDRIDSTKGYTRDNTAVICMWCNSRKTNFTISDLQMLLRYMQSSNPI